MSAPPGLTWDTDIKGFGLRVSDTGRRTYFFKYRFGSGQQAKQRKRSLGTTSIISCEQARSRCREWAASVALGDDPAASPKTVAPLTMSDLAARYMREHAMLKKRRSSAEEDHRMLQRFILPAFEKMDVSQVSRTEVFRLHHELNETPYQANRVLALLSKMFQLADAWGLIVGQGNPCRFVKKYPEAPRERYLDGVELARFWREVERLKETSPHAAGFLAAAILTGLRKRELLTLKWSNVDIQGQTLWLPQTKTTPRQVPLSRATCDVLHSLPRIEGNPYVFPGRNPGGHLVGIQKIWTRVRSQAELHEVRIHDLRHTFASIGVGNSLTLPEIGALMGHASISTTARYAHLSNDRARRSANIIGNAASGHHQTP